jgi:hypothetical protein
MFLMFVLKANDENREDPDPLVRGTDPQIRIRTKLSRIRNTAVSKKLHHYEKIKKEPA